MSPQGKLYAAMQKQMDYLTVEDIKASQAKFASSWDRAWKPRVEIMITFDTRKGIVHGAERAYGYYQTSYKFFPGQTPGYQWAQRQAYRWGNGWVACPEDKVPAEVKLAVTLMQ